MNNAQRKLRRERAKYWMLKDRKLTNRQICELTGVAERVVTQLRRELDLPALSPDPVHKDVDTAFKKLMEQQGKPVQKQSKEFNPWVAYPKRKDNEEKSPSGE